MRSCRALGTELIDAMFTQAGPGIAVSAFSGGSLLNNIERGQVDLESHRDINSDTAFHVASVSKHFTAYAIAQLIAEKKISLDDRIGSYLPFVSEPAKGITIGQLLFHTSGLSDQWILLSLAGWSDRDLVLTSDINRLIGRQGALKHSPGSAFSYTNTGYTLLAEIVETVVNCSLDAYLQANTFLPAGMSHTRFKSDPSVRADFEAECYTQAGSKFIKTTPRFSTVGATSLQTSMADLARWETIFMSPRDDMRELIRRKGTLATGEPISYGFGVYHGEVGALNTLSHSGWDADFSSFILYIPDRRIGAAVLSNGSQMNLELIALSFLTDFVDFGSLTEEIRIRLATMLASNSRTSRPGPLYATRKFFGCLDSGDVRLWENTEKGQSLVGGAIQRVEKIDEGSYMLGASLSTLTFEEGWLCIYSPTQNQRQKLAPLPDVSTHQEFLGPLTFFSEELQVTHTVSVVDGRMVWSRPGHEALELEQIGPALFFSGGFTLRICEDELTISSARSAPIRFAAR